MGVAAIALEARSIPVQVEEEESSSQRGAAVIPIVPRIERIETIRKNIMDWTKWSPLDEVDVIK